MAGVLDRHRRFVIDGRPVVTGLAAVGDAWACTNPSAGRGALGRCRARPAPAPASCARRSTVPTTSPSEWDAVTEAELAPWYWTPGRSTDEARLAELARCARAAPTAVTHRQPAPARSTSPRPGGDVRRRRVPGAGRDGRLPRAPATRCSGDRACGTKVEAAAPAEAMVDAGAHPRGAARPPRVSHRFRGHGTSTCGQGPPMQTVPVEAADLTAELDVGGARHSRSPRSSSSTTPSPPTSAPASRSPTRPRVRDRPTLFVKLAPLDPAHRQMVGATGMGEREVQFYADVVPHHRPARAAATSTARATTTASCCCSKTSAVRGCQFASNGEWGVAGRRRRGRARAARRVPRALRGRRRAATASMPWLATPKAEHERGDVGPDALGARRERRASSPTTTPPSASSTSSTTRGSTRSGTRARRRTSTATPTSADVGVAVDVRRRTRVPDLVEPRVVLDVELTDGGVVGGELPRVLVEHPPHRPEVASLMLTFGVASQGRRSRSVASSNGVETRELLERDGGGVGGDAPFAIDANRHPRAPRSSSSSTKASSALAPK